MFQVNPEHLTLQNTMLREMSKQANILYFDQFMQSLTPLYERGNMPDVIRIAKDEDSLLAGDYEPLVEINIKDNIHLLDYKGFPMWHNQSSDEFSLHGLGLIEGNKSQPSQYTLFDTNPHGNIGGATGHGKSVLANGIIIAASLVHPPWLVQYYLSDPKITEMKPYATSEYKLPHVDSVAATEDPEYAISVLEYLLLKMDKRANIYDKFKVKNIASFNKKSGLIMPMMVLILDELKAMLQTAGRRAGHVDKLIQAFVAKARFAGGRCLMLSQGVVTELDPATMKNINVRIALGCTPAESEKLVGNPGAAVNLGSMGKITFNNTPYKTLDTNVYMNSPFLPDSPNDHTGTIYDIFEHQQKVWEALTTPGFRISPLSFFDQTEPLTKEYFMNSIGKIVDQSHIFLGEPVYINKSEYEMAFINLLPDDEFSSNLGNNIIFFSSIGKERLNFTLTLLMNFDKLAETRETTLAIYSPLKSTNDTIKKFGNKVDAFIESNDVADAFGRAVSQALIKILTIKTDQTVFDPDVQEKDATPIIEELIKRVEEFNGSELSNIMRRRVIEFAHLLQEQLSVQVLELGDVLIEKTLPMYVDACIFLVEDLIGYGCEHTQYTASKSTVDLRVFFDFHMLNGTEVKTNRMMDMWMNVVKQAPEYGFYFIIISDMLPSCGSSLNGVFNKLVFFEPTSACIGQHKLSDDFPSSTLPVMYVYADKTKTVNKCVKVKKVTAIS